MTEQLDTERLVLRALTETDCEGMYAVLTDTDFVRYVGDRGVRTPDDARAYLRDGPMATWRLRGYGLYAVERRADSLFVGICGLVKRPTLDDVDLGFAFLPAFRGLGYAHESAQAVVEHARTALRLPRLIAIVSPDNAPSRSVLARLGLQPDPTYALPVAHDGLLLYSVTLCDDSPAY